jgi:CspA family cold shock protein
MVFKDQIVRCAACGTDFIYTVREQRLRADRGLSTEPPAFCPDCRAADSRLAEAELEISTVDGSITTSPGGTAPGGRSGPPRRQSGGGRPQGRGGAGRPRGRQGGGHGDRRGGKRPRPHGQGQTELRFRHLGVVKWFDETKGYGFIAQDDDGSELFVHSSAILVQDLGYLLEGQPVEYEVEHTPRGLQAVDVIPLDA